MASVRFRRSHILIVDTSLDCNDFCRLGTCTRTSTPQTCSLNYQGSIDNQLLDLVQLKTLQPHQWDWPVVPGFSGPATSSGAAQGSPLAFNLTQHRPDPRVMVTLDNAFWGLEGGDSSRGHRRIYRRMLDLHTRWRRGELRTEDLRTEIGRTIMHLPFMLSEHAPE
jgi:hypothetical protein